jgi:3-hydroxybutyryl-CoA dehydrogenase
MGSGICEVLARAGLPVTVIERDDERRDAGRERLSGSLQRGVDKGKLEPDGRETILSRVTGDTELNGLADADLVVEAVPEDVETKTAVFTALDDVLGEHALIATNTSSLPITDLAVATKRADRVVGFHFFNPAPVMELVELITTVVSSPEAVETVRSLAEQLGKTPVVAGDRAGFVANLLLFPYLNQAVGMLESGYATREDIDAAMRLGTGQPMGPLALLDLIGLDSAANIMERMYEHFGSVRHAPRSYVRHLKAAGYTGRKAGRGFYEHGNGDDPGFTADQSGRVPLDPDAVAGWATIGVAGTGTMATGIAEVCARAGYDVVVRGRSQDKAEAAIGSVGKRLAKSVDRGKLDAEQRDEILDRLSATEELAAFGGCDAVIEAVVEDVDVKYELFAALAEHTKPEALLATTTSSLPVIDCAMATDRPERVVGLHFFNPAPAMRLVEVVHTVRAETAAVRQARALTDALGKHGVVCADRAGFVVNALLFPYLNDAVKMLESGYASVADIDAAMKLGCGHPMGPFELMDVVGLDVTQSIVKALHEEFREPGFAPSPLLGHMVSAGYLGRKTGRGFHVYS